MHVLITCKYEKDLMKNSGENVMMSFMGIFSDAQGHMDSIVHGRIRPNFELIQAYMYVIITCKYENDLIKNS